MKNTAIREIWHANSRSIESTDIKEHWDRDSRREEAVGELLGLKLSGEVRRTEARQGEAVQGRGEAGLGEAGQGKTMGGEAELVSVERQASQSRRNRKRVNAVRCGPRLAQVGLREAITPFIKIHSYLRPSSRRHAHAGFGATYRPSWGGVVTLVFQLIWFQL
ncbi:hypothetical protein E2C01_044494 [Portunus trituberculatus]|uniref:Uncharacterized protein n=1 Tax=Portunus trituberculatus TaxID=210409 RepID=A0A5B7G2H7_PORTR|nr:hypothetical protein [Portunus trituberculatus]